MALSILLKEKFYPVVRERSLWFEALRKQAAEWRIFWHDFVDDRNPLHHLLRTMVAMPMLVEMLSMMREMKPVPMSWWRMVVMVARQHFSINEY